jgi:hypothetical protein
LEKSRNLKLVKKININEVVIDDIPSKGDEIELFYTPNQTQILRKGLTYQFVLTNEGLKLVKTSLNLKE